MESTIDWISILVDEAIPLKAIKPSRLISLKYVWLFGWQAAYAALIFF